MSWDNNKHLMQITLDNELSSRLAHYAVDQHCSKREAIPKILEQFLADAPNDFEEWKAINSGKIEELADYFIAHDTEHFFTGGKYKEAYKKIETLCRIAFERR